MLPRSQTLVHGAFEVTTSRYPCNQTFISIRATPAGVFIALVLPHHDRSQSLSSPERMTHALPEVRFSGPPRWLSG